MLYRGKNLPERIAVKRIFVIGEAMKAYLRKDKQFILDLLKDDVTHPNIMQYYAFDWEEDSKEANIVMEQADTNLWKYLNENGAVDFGVACNFAEQIASGLKFLHDKNVSHRDLKPSNIMLFGSEGGDEQKTTLKLCDFGQAVLSDLESIITRSYTDVGTQRYFSPEMWRAFQVVLHSVNILIYYYISGNSDRVNHSCCLVAK
jgi:serine/threonine protein kinase